MALARELGADYVITSTADRDVPYTPGDVQASFSRLHVSLPRAVTAESKLGSDVTPAPARIGSRLRFGVGDGAWSARTGVAWSPATALELGLALRLPDAALELDVAWATAEVLDAALLTPSAWAFVDVAAFDDAGVTRGTWALGVGAGIEGALFRIVPLGVGLDVAYGVGSRSWALGWRLGRPSPVPWRW